MSFDTDKDIGTVDAPAMVGGSYVRVSINNKEPKEILVCVGGYGGADAAYND